ncbi:unnamed protein product [Sphenostylis stenocarpa]|uniref:Uncharacterized protein n=1 Tax=Sphenostylis stenocarpa TaxID=92480 RepID=A0AA86VEJ4_9FABA|nr:unnamed protein product [Sphenostylis stenocarpa]
MDGVTKLLNLAVPPLTLILLCVCMLPSLIFKQLMYVKKSVYKENVANKVVLITGAGSGIGEQIAYEYARRGAKLSLVDIREEKLVAVADKTRSLGCPDVTIIGADVSKVQDCKRFVDETVKYFGRLDHLVNNAGICPKPVKVENLRDISEYTQVMDVNFWGAVNGTLHAIPHLKMNKGRIVVIASVSGWFPVPRIGFYSASKAAVINFFESVRLEVGGDIGITIATPGMIKTDLALKAIKHEKGLEGRIPLASSSECAKAIVEGACRGDMFVTNPSWFKMLFPCKVLYPQTVDWACRLFFGSSPNKSNMEANHMMSENKILRFIVRSLFRENVAGKVILITGASSGIGEHLAYEYAKLLGSPDVITIPADVSRAQDCQRFVESTINHFGRCGPFAIDIGFEPLGIEAEYVQLPNTKTAVISLYETLRTELGRNIGITIVTPGLIESEMSQGKILTKEGKMVFDQQITDMQVSVMPIRSVTEAANAIVNSVCRGGLSLISKSPEKDPVSKKVLDLTGLKKYVYPKSARSPNMKPC